MPFIEEIVCLINDKYKSVFTDKLFAKKMVYGITQPVQRNDANSKITVIPGYLEGSEFRYVGPDDIDNLIIYHKLYNNAYSSVTGTQYGRSNGLQKCISDMSVVVFAMTKINKSRHQLEQLLNQNLLDKITKAKLTEFQLNSVLINVVSSNMDMVQVFNNEFKNIPYNLTEDNILFEMKYRIESVYKKECFLNC